MSYRSGDRIECRRFSRQIEDIDSHIQCTSFKAKEQDLEEVVNSTAKYYQEIGHEYDELWYSSDCRMQHNEFYSLVEGKLARLSSSKMLVLDAGCGTCEWATVMMKKGAFVAGFDQSLKMLRSGKYKAASRKLTQNLNVICGDLRSLPFKERTFDGATTIFVLSHLPEDRTKMFLDELRRVMKREGWMLFADSKFRQPHQERELQVRTLKNGQEYTVYKRYFTAIELENLLEKQFSRSFHALEVGRYIVCSTG